MFFTLVFYFWFWYQGMLAMAQVIFILKNIYYLIVAYVALILKILFSHIRNCLWQFKIVTPHFVDQIND
jgi:hypothetical protein